MATLSSLGYNIIRNDDRNALTGTNGKDAIFGSSRNRGGDDLLCGAGGDDHLSGMPATTASKAAPATTT